MNATAIPTDLLKTGSSELGIELSDAQVEKLVRFASLLLEWNRKFNLTRITDPHEIVIKHLLDSFTCLKAADFPENASVIDVGTGAGLPGIPLKIVRSDLQTTLLDATRKKLTFLEAVVRDLGLTGVLLVHGRAEDVGQDQEMRERYDVVTARAVSEMRVLAEYTLPLARIGGVVIAQKGPDIDVELDDARKAVSLLGGRIERVERITLPCSDASRTLVAIRKQAPTPRKYPRRQAEITRRPL